jgi:hypothetical protein
MRLFHKFYFFFHLAAFLAKLALFFCSGVALGLFNTALACSWTLLPALLAEAVNLPLFFFFIYILFPFFYLGINLLPSLNIGISVKSTLVHNSFKVVYKAFNSV